MGGNLFFSPEAGTISLGLGFSDLYCGGLIVGNLLLFRIANRFWMLVFVGLFLYLDI